MSTNIATAINKSCVINRIRSGYGYSDPDTFGVRRTEKTGQVNSWISGFWFQRTEAGVFFGAGRFKKVLLSGQEGGLHL